jgi:hypothetical protein
MASIFRKIFKSKRPLIVVSGLPRSGTSMMMKMLDATGIPPLTDHVREADADNPKGYYEFERVKKLKEGDVAWLPEAEGKATKIISALLVHMPLDYEYRVLMMRRKMEEIIASQDKMLERRGEESKVPDEKMAELYRKHMRQVEEWMNNQPNVTYIDVDYNALLEDPQLHLARINHFLGGDLDIEKMAAVVDPDLYRQRK